MKIQHTNPNPQFMKLDLIQHISQQNKTILVQYIKRTRNIIKRIHVYGRICLETKQFQLYIYIYMDMEML